MTLKEAIKQTENLTKDQKIQLAYYILFSNLKEDSRDNLMQLFQYEDDFELKKKEQATKKRVFKSKGQIQLNNDFDVLNIRENFYNDLLKQYD
ncbi:MAG: hypothetical protein B6I20_04675 [Bacteroidetes bacterium 4572_117]|nr:MAG: hypothetical protein B6I20_04675 [Bacteroidetes bacterium 4572_117]